ncbi:hypothetical protein BZA77DRAFT_362538 [Pyronema omphalodes]|nr:hypothetical protein BZA77DRAFT_362538 [Pyronema omphalodes]
MDFDVILNAISGKPPNKRHRDQKQDLVERTDEVEKVVINSDARSKRIEKECLDSLREQVATLRQLLREQQDITEQSERRFSRLAVEAQQMSKTTRAESKSPGVDKGRPHSKSVGSHQPANTIQPNIGKPLAKGQSYAEASKTNGRQVSKQHKRLITKQPTIFTPARNLRLEDRSLIFTRREGVKPTHKAAQEMMAAINNCLFYKSAPGFHRIAEAVRNAKRSITAFTCREVDARTLISNYRHEIVNAIGEAEPGMIEVQESEKWVKFKVPGIPLNRFMDKGSHAV